jgi:hypothetical protein
MKKEGIAVIILRFLRTILLIDLVLAVIVALVCFFLDLRTMEAYGTVLVWVGVGVMMFAGITGVGGFASRGEDAVAYSLSGAGNMIENLQRITDARTSNLGCFAHLIAAAIVLIAVGYLIQIIPALL